MNVELNMERTLGGNVASAANVIFDNIITQEGQISYNAATGVITLNKPGGYIVNWSVVTETTLSNVGVGFALSSSAGDFIQGDSVLKTGEVTGFGIIHADASGETLSLVNSTADSIVYSSIVPIKASLILFQETAGVTGPTEPLIYAQPFSLKYGERLLGSIGPHSPLQSMCIYCSQ